MTTIRKKLATAAEIQAEIARRLAKHPRCSGCSAPLPLPADRAFYLANWRTEAGPAEVPGCGEVRAEIVLAVMREYDLAEG